MKRYSTVWEALLAAREFDWSARGSHRVMVGRSALELGGDGQWQADRPLTAEDVLLLDALLPLLAGLDGMVVGQLGQSLDGRIATASGDSWYINGPVARCHLHRLRALVDAVVIGAGTASEDQPHLTVRHVSGRDPVAVILDPRGRVPPQGPLFERLPDAAPVLHLVAEGVDPGSAPPGVERLFLPATSSGVDPRLVVQRLAERGLRRVLIEGGGVTVSRFLEADCLDRLHLLIAPLIIGSGRPGLQLEPIQRLAKARRPPIRSHALGDELLVDVLLR